MSAPTSSASFDVFNPPILNELICLACNHILNRPKQLTYCGHVFCYECIHKLAKPATNSSKPNAMTIECPDCGYPSHLSIGLQGLRTNLPLYNITERVRAYEKWYATKKGETGAEPADNTAPTEKAKEAGCCEEFSEESCTICKHCAGKFCSSCMSSHCSEAAKEAKSFAQKLMSHITRISVSIEDLNLDKICKEFDQSLENLAGDVSSTITSSLCRISDATRDQAMNLIQTAKTDSLEKLHQLKQAVEKWKDNTYQRNKIAYLIQLVGSDINQDDITSVFDSLKTLNSEVALVMEYKDSVFPSWEFTPNPDYLQYIDTLSNRTALGCTKFSLASSSQTPQPAESISTGPLPESTGVAASDSRQDIVYSAMTSDDVFFTDGALATTESVTAPKTHLPSFDEASYQDLPPLCTPSWTPPSSSFSFLAPYDKLFYDDLKVLGSLSGNDYLGDLIVSPTGSCLVESPKYHPIIAFIHNGRKISLLSEFMLESTFIVQNPDDIKENLYLGWEITSDNHGHLFVICHQRKRILTFSIASALNNPDNVVPSVFARSNRISDKKFHGLAVNNSQRLLFSAVADGIAAFKLEDGLGVFLVSIPSSIRSCSVVGLNYTSDDTYQIIVTHSLGRKLHAFTLPKSRHPDETELSQNGCSFGCLYEYENPCQAIAVDQVGNALMYDSHTKKVDVYTSSGQLMSTVNLETICEIDPRSLTLVPPYKTRAVPLLVATDLAGNTITSFSCLF